MYVDILKIHMLSYAIQNMFASWYFQQDNEPKYVSKYVRDFMKCRKIKVLEWPCQSSDLGPTIEFLWVELDRTVPCQSFSNKVTLYESLKNERYGIPED